MKLLLVLLCALAAAEDARRDLRPVANAATTTGTGSFTYGVHSASLITPTQQQYHAQDTNGQYAYGYAEPLSSKREVRTLDGITRGSYSYVDATGQLQTVDYTADADGFHVTATNLPQPLPFRAALVAPAAVTAIADAARSDRSAPAAAHSPAVAVDAPAGLRLAGVQSAAAAAEFDAVDATDRRVELSDALAYSPGAGVIASPATFVHKVAQRPYYAHYLPFRYPVRRFLSRFYY